MTTEETPRYYTVPVDGPRIPAALQALLDDINTPREAGRPEGYRPGGVIHTYDDGGLEVEAPRFRSWKAVRAEVAKPAPTCPVCNPPEPAP